MYTIPLTVNSHFIYGISEISKNLGSVILLVKSAKRPPFGLNSDVSGTKN